MQRLISLWCIAHIKWAGIKDERGVTAVEQGILIALIAAAIIVAVRAAGRSL